MRNENEHSTVTIYLTTQPASMPAIDWHPPRIADSDSATIAIEATIREGYEVIAYGPASPSGSRKPRIIHAGDDAVQPIHPGDPIALLARGVLTLGDHDWARSVDDAGRTLRDYCHRS